MFNPERLSLIVQPVGDGGIRFYSYQTDDVEATVTGAGYATNASDYGLRTYDLIFVSPLSGAVDTYILAVDAIDADGHATLASPGPIGDLLAANNLSDIPDPATALANLGGMAKATYDPGNVAGDAFAMDNMVEGANTKILTADERAKLAEVVSVDEPADIAALTVDLARPAINVLGYPTSPGARHDWVRVASEPAHPMKQQSLDGQWWAPSPFNVRAEHFGAWVSGSRVDQTLSNALDYALQLEHAQLIMPPGVGVIEATVSKTLDTRNHHLAIVGSGREVTRLEVDAVSLATGAIHLDQPLTGTFNYGRFADFSVYAVGEVSAVDAYAIRFRRPIGGARHGRTVEFENVMIYGKSIGTDFFYGGIDIYGALHPYIRNCTITGPWGPGTGGDFADTAVIYKPEVGINMDETYGGMIADTFIWSAKNGILNRSAEAQAGEGIHLVRSNMVNVKNGMIWERASPEPTFFMDRCHINYRDNGLYIDGCKLIDVTNSVIYQEDTTQQAPSAPRDFFMRNVLQARYSDNRHHFTGDPRRNCYLISDTGTNEQEIEIRRPQITGTTLTAIVHALGTSKFTLVDPFVSTDSTITGTLGGTYSLANVEVQYSRTKTTRVALITTNQSIPDTLASEAAISWNSEDQDDLGLWASSPNPTRFTRPADSGVKQMRIRAQITWASNATGSRQLRVKKNGATVGYGGTDLRAANNTNNIQHIDSGWIDVAGSDYIEIFAGQSSGGSLDVVAGVTNTWCQVETR